MGWGDCSVGRSPSVKGKTKLWILRAPVNVGWVWQPPVILVWKGKVGVPQGTSLKQRAPHRAERDPASMNTVQSDWRRHSMSTSIHFSTRAWTSENREACSQEETSFHLRFRHVAAGFTVPPGGTKKYSEKLGPTVDQVTPNFISFISHEVWQLLWVE